MPHFRQLKRSNIYKVMAFAEPPSRTLSLFLFNKVRLIEDTSALILNGPAYREGMYIQEGVRVRAISGGAKGIEATLPIVRLIKVRKRIKCTCAALPFPHFPSSSCIKETPNA